MCAHLEGAYADLPHGPLPHSEAAHRRCILLPLYAQMTDDDQAQVVAALAEALAAEGRAPGALRDVA
jgi:dTDP-4-amino-4,6-dideoxygalactose transaminase